MREVSSQSKEQISHFKLHVIPHVLETSWQKYNCRSLIWPKTSPKLEVLPDMRGKPKNRNAIILQCRWTDGRKPGLETACKSQRKMTKIDLSRERNIMFISFHVQKDGSSHRSPLCQNLHLHIPFSRLFRQVSLMSPQHSDGKNKEINNTYPYPSICT